MRRRRSTLSWLLCLAVFSAACSGGSGEDTDADNAAPVVDSDEPVTGGVLRVAMLRPAHLDPALARPVPQTEAMVADLLFDGLTAWDQSEGEAVPALAERWSAGPALREWQFELRAGSRFSDGSPVRARDVVATIERVRRVGDLVPAGALVGGVAEVEAMGRNTVRIELEEPLATLPEVLSSPLLGVVPDDAGDVGRRRFDRRPVGSGPFALDRVRPGRMTLVRSEGSDAFLDGVDLVFHDDLDDAAAAVADGDADWSLARASDDADGAGSVDATPFSASLFYGLNLAAPDLADPRFREAIVRAVDRRALADDVYEGAVDPHAAIVPEGVVGASADPCRRRCRFDPERARELVAEAFPAGGVPEVSIDFDAGARQQEVAEAMVADLFAVGIPSAPRPHPADEYDHFVATGDQELFRLGWTGAYPSADAFLAPLFIGEAPDNVLGLVSPEVDLRVAAALAEDRAGARARRLARAERTVMAAFPVLPVGQFRTWTVVGEQVRGLELAVTGTFDATDVWLAPDG